MGTTGKHQVPARAVLAPAPVGTQPPLLGVPSACQPALSACSPCAPAVCEAELQGQAAGVCGAGSAGGSPGVLHHEGLGPSLGLIKSLASTSEHPNQITTNGMERFVGWLCITSVNSWIHRSQTWGTAGSAGCPGPCCPYASSGHTEALLSHTAREGGAHLASRCSAWLRAPQRCKPCCQPYPALCLLPCPNTTACSCASSDDATEHL